MDDGDLVDENSMDLDLNQEPVEPSLPSVARVGPLRDELETANGRIEERIRQLAVVTARARQRQRSRQESNPMHISHFSNEMLLDLDAEGGALGGIDSTGMVDRTAEKGKGSKRNSSHLVAKALEMNSEVRKAVKEGGSFYDCHICLDLARDPVLTCCGHLFCWACFYQVSNVDPTSKECPVCKGEVSNSTIVPIYGNGDSESVCETESGLRIPPRPKARRVESVRQPRVTRHLSHGPVAEALGRIHTSTGAMGNPTQQDDGGNSILNFYLESRGRQSAGSGSRHVRIYQVSRVLSPESAASISSLTSALSNAERLVEDLETVINNRFSGSDPHSSVDVGNPFTGHSAGLQPNNQLPASTADSNSVLPNASSPQSTDVSGPAVHLSVMRSSTGINIPIPPYFLRRRNIISRTSDGDRQDTRESRRRRSS